MINIEDKDAIEDYFLMPVGIGMDIPTSRFITGKYGETIVVGGCGPFTGVTGYGNNFKSTIMHFFALQIANRYRASDSETTLHTYDTELTLQKDRLRLLSARHKYLYDNAVNDLFDSEKPVWTLTNNTKMLGEEWVKLLYKSGTEYLKSKPKMLKVTCFRDRKGNYPLELPRRTIIENDSLTKMKSQASFTIAEKKGLADSSAKTIALVDGNMKQKFMDLTNTMSSNFGYQFLMSVHLGKKINMDGPKYGVVAKEVQHMSDDDKFMGATPDFNRLATHIYTIGNLSELKDKETKLSEFPYDNDDILTKDLFKVPVSITRNKTGPSAQAIQVVVSQTEGVQPELTTFYYLKTNDRYGFLGNNTTYQLALRPEINLTRKKIRKLMKEDALLAKASEFMMEMHQLRIYKHSLVIGGYVVTPQELYKDLKEMGYDMNLLLDTRSWWTPDHYNPDLPKYLSVIDLLKIRRGEYHPYWYPKKGIVNNNFLESGKFESMIKNLIKTKQIDEGALKQIKEAENL